MKQILGTLKYCEKHNLIHGDIDFNNFRFENNDRDSLIKI
jgi:serine/threonine protein kinase